MSNIKYQIGIRKEDIDCDVVKIVVREDGSFESNVKMRPWWRWEHGLENGWKTAKRHLLDYELKKDGLPK